MTALCPTFMVLLFPNTVLGVMQYVALTEIATSKAPDIMVDFQISLSSLISYCFVEFGALLPGTSLFRFFFPCKIELLYYFIIFLSCNVLLIKFIVLNSTLSI